MGTLLNPIFGKPRGKVGDLVFRNVHGKTIISRKPSARSKSSFSPAEIAKQKMFGINCKLSKCINQIDVFKVFWQKAANGKMNTFNAIAKANYPIIGIDGFESLPKLTPGSFPLDFSEYGFYYDHRIISIELKPDLLGIVKDYKIDNRVLAAGVICLSGAKECGLDNIKFVPVKTDYEEVSPGDESVLVIELTEHQQSVINMYESREFFFGFISMDKDGNIINEISTFSEDLHAEEE